MEGSAHERLSEALHSLATGVEPPRAATPPATPVPDQVEDDYGLSNSDDLFGGYTPPAAGTPDDSYVAFPFDETATSHRPDTPMKSMGGEPFDAAASAIHSPAATASRQVKTPARRPPPRKKSHDMKATAIPLLITVGGLLLVPAIWGVLVLVGAGVPGAGREDSGMMAGMMLGCWPIALCLIYYGVYLLRKLQRAKKAAA